MEEKINGLRMFLYGVLSLIKTGESIKYNIIEEKIGTGIASFLFFKYEKHFSKVGFNPDNLEVIDEFYKKSFGITEGQENKYDCQENDGLYLIIKLALNEVF